KSSTRLLPPTRPLPPTLPLTPPPPLTRTLSLTPPPPPTQPLQTMPPVHPTSTQALPHRTPTPPRPASSARRNRCNNGHKRTRSFVATPRGSARTQPTRSISAAVESCGSSVTRSSRKRPRAREPIHGSCVTALPSSPAAPILRAPKRPSPGERPAGKH